MRGYYAAENTGFRPLLLYLSLHLRPRLKVNELMVNERMAAAVTTHCAALVRQGEQA
jgi:hypothetical protein